MVIRTIVPQHPARHVLARHRDASSLVDALWRDLGGFGSAGCRPFDPRIDVSETEAELRLTAELPGLASGDFGVTVEDDVITIQGEKKRLEEAGEPERGRLLAERTCGPFARSFRMPFEVEPESVRAAYRKGLLTVVVPKPSEDAPRERMIPVTTA